MDPINPTDHSFDGNPHGLENMVKAEDHGHTTARGNALIEAIHQTFERDARAEAAFESAQKAWENGEPSGNTNVYRRDEDGELVMEPTRSRFKPQPDPDTEIDRVARLIVDGEYRRRVNERTEQ